MSEFISKVSEEKLPEFELKKRSPTVLLVDSSPFESQRFYRGLTNQGMNVHVSHALDQAHESLQVVKPNLVVVDVSNVGYPHELQRKKKDNESGTSIPYIVLGKVDSNQTTNARIDALERGADFFLQKPLDADFLGAHIRASLRSLESKKKDDVVNIGDLKIVNNIYFTKQGYETVLLTPQEYKIFKSLLDNRGRVITSESLARVVGLEDAVQAVRVYITKIRNKVRDMDENPDFIENVRGVGYLMSHKLPGKK